MILNGVLYLLTYNICAYWLHVSNMGEEKYKNVSYIAKAVLTLSHGNASPETGFSVNSALVTKERESLSERSVVALRVVKEAIRLFGSCRISICRLLLRREIPCFSCHILH